MGKIEQKTRDEVMSAVFEKCLEILDDPNVLRKGAFFGLVGLDKKKQQYTNILEKSNALPEDASLVDLSAKRADPVKEAPAPKAAAKKGKR